MKEGMIIENISSRALFTFNQRMSWLHAPSTPYIEEPQRDESKFIKIFRHQNLTTTTKIQRETTKNCQWRYLDEIKNASGGKVEANARIWTDLLLISKSIFQTTWAYIFSSSVCGWASGWICFCSWHQMALMLLLSLWGRVVQWRVATLGVVREP